MSFFISRRIPLKQEEFVSENTARFYDEHARRFMGPVYRRFATRLSDFKLNSNQVLDIGAGTGCLSIELVGAHPEWHITGIDISEDMLKLARENAAREKLSGRIDFRSASVAALPFADGYFSLVVSNASLHLWPDPAGAFKEIDRVTAPGGYCVIWDNLRLAVSGPLIGLLGRAMGMNASQRRLWAEAVRSSYTLGEVKVLLKNSSLCSARLETILRFLYLGIYWQKPAA